MTSLQDYLRNPHWRALYERSLIPMNYGALPQWHQGSVGGNSPMVLWSNENTYGYMKRGQETLLPYHSNLQSLRGVIPAIRRQVHECNHSTLNPVKCEEQALLKLIRQGYGQ